MIASAFRPGRRLLLTSVIVAVTGAVAWSTAHAGPLEDAALQAAIDGLATSSDDKISESVTKLGALDDPRAIPALDALGDERLRLGADGHAYVWNSKTRDLRNAVTGQVVTPEPRPLKEVEVRQRNPAGGGGWCKRSLSWRRR